MVGNDINKNHHEEDGDAIERIATSMDNLLA